MKKLIFTLILLVLAFSLKAQSVGISYAGMTPTPLQCVEENGSGTATIWMVESSGQPVPALAGGVPNVIITINLSNIELTGGLTSSITGNLLDYFTASYDSVTNIITFTQSQIIPADSLEIAYFPFTVTQNSPVVFTNGYSAIISSNDPGTNSDGNSTIYTRTINTTLAINDINNTFVDVAISGNVLTNDIDVQGDVQSVNTTLVTQPTNGTVAINADGTYTYTPNAGFVGTDTFVYEVCDNISVPACDTATVTIEVLAVPTPNTNDAPIANDDTAITEVDTPVSGNVLPNDIDPDGDTLTVNTTPTTVPTNGTVAINTDGTFTYTPNAGFEGTDSFVYEVCDNGSPSLCDTATVTIDVLPSDNGANDTYANDDAVNGDQDTIISGNVLDNDTDPENDAQEVNIVPVTLPTNGTVTLNTNGTFDYVPNADFSGTDSFVYQVCDNASPTVACDTATVYITVNDTYPDFIPTLITSISTFQGPSAIIDFVTVVSENNNIVSDGTPIELRIYKRPEIVISYDSTLTTLNGFSVENANWLFDNSSPAFYRFTYTGNNGVFAASTASLLGINAQINPSSTSEGTLPIKVSIKYFSGGEIKVDNNDDFEYIQFINNN